MAMYMLELNDSDKQDILVLLDLAAKALVGQGGVNAHREYMRAVELASKVASASELEPTEG